MAPIVLVPLTLPQLGDELFGAWMALVAITSMLIWADLGLGGSLLTQLTPLLARGDHRSARKLIGTAYAIVVAVALSMTTCVMVSANLVDWGKLLGVSASNADAATSIAATCLVIFFINAPLALIQRIQYAAREVSAGNAYVGLGSILSVAAAGAAVLMESRPVVVVAAASIGPAVANCIATAFFFRRRTELIPRRADIERSAGAVLMRLGVGLLVVSLVAAAATATDGLIIAQARDAAAVTEFSVPARLLGALGLAITVVNLPLWPLNAAALAEGRIDWVRRTTRRMVIASAGTVALGGMAFLALASPITRLLSHGDHTAPRSLVAGLVLWWVMIAAGSPLAMVQNACGKIKVQLWGWVIFILLSVPTKYFVATHWGISTVPFIGAAYYVVIMLPAMFLGYARALESRVGRPLAESAGVLP